jgi:hypothetical protein
MNFNGLLESTNQQRIRFKNTKIHIRNRTGTFHVKTPKDFQFLPPENLNQIFSTDFPINLKKIFITPKLSKMNSNFRSPLKYSGFPKNCISCKMRKYFHLYAEIFLCFFAPTSPMELKIEQFLRRTGFS